MRNSKDKNTAYVQKFREDHPDYLARCVDLQRCRNRAAARVVKAHRAEYDQYFEEEKRKANL